MNAFVATLLDLTLGRRGPDTLPASWALFAVLAAIVLALQALSILVLQQGSERDVVYFTAIGLGGYCLYALLLALNGKSARIQQTLSAIAAVDVVLSVAGFGVSLVVLLPLIGGELALLVLLAILVGYVYRVATILAAALEWPLAAALAMSLAVTLTGLAMAERYRAGNDALPSASASHVPDVVARTT